MLKYRYEINPVSSVACPLPISTNGAATYVMSDTCYSAWCFVAPGAMPGTCVQIISYPKVVYFELFYLEDASALGTYVDPFGLCTDGCEWTTDQYGCRCVIDFKRNSYRVPRLSLVTYVNVIDEFD